MTKSKLAALVALALPTASFSQAPAVDYSIAQPASGSWSYVAVPGGSEARFTDSTATIRLTIHCTKANRRVMISHTSSAPAASLNVWTSSATRSLPARFEPQAMRVSADLAIVKGRTNLCRAAHCDWGRRGRGAARGAGYFVGSCG